MAFPPFLALLLQTPQPPAPIGDVTYVTQGAPAGQVLRDLSSKIGLTLLTAPNVEHEMLVLSLRNKPAKEVLAKVAWAVGGSWKKEGETYRLVRTGEDVAAEQARERRFFVESFTQSLAKRRADLSDQGELTPDKANAIAKDAAVQIQRFDPEVAESWEFRTRLAQRSPVGRALVRMSAYLSPEALADLPRGIRVVYASHPTRAQLPLDKAVYEVAANLQREQAVWQAAMTRHRVENPSDRDSIYDLVPASDPEGQDAKPGKILLAVTRSRNAAPFFELELLIADAQGKFIVRGETGIGPEFPRTPQRDRIVVKKGEDVATLSEKAFSAGADGIPAELRSRLLQPERYDPVGILAGESLLNAAQARGVDLVASLSDTGAFDRTFRAKETPYPEWLRLERMTNEVREEEGWLAIRPHVPSDRAFQANRAVLGRYLRRRGEVSGLSVEERAEWAVKLPSPFDSPMIRLLASAVTRGSMIERHGGGDERLLRFFGSLSKAQRAAAKGAGMPLAGLSPEQRALIGGIVYAPSPPLEPNDARAAEMKIDVNRYFIGLRREATESVPNGIPPEGRLEIEEAVQDVVFTADAGTPTRPRPGLPLTAKDVAWRQYIQTRADLFPEASDPGLQADLHRLRLGRQRRYIVRIHVAPLLMLQDVLEDREYVAKGPVKVENLPTAFRAEVARHLEEFRKRYANRKPRVTPPATQNPPPPTSP